MLRLMNTSFQEKSIWSVLLSLVGVFGYYFYRVSNPSLGDSETFGLFVVAVVVLVILLAVLHVGIAIHNTREASQGGDERDTLIELKATRISSTVLSVGALLSAGLWLTDATPLNMANAILLSLVVAEMAQCVMQLFYYRRGL